MTEVHTKNSSIYFRKYLSNFFLESFVWKPNFMILVQTFEEIHSWKEFWKKKLGFTKSVRSAAVIVGSRNWEVHRDAYSKFQGKLMMDFVGPGFTANVRALLSSRDTHKFHLQHFLTYLSPFSHTELFFSENCWIV